MQEIFGIAAARAATYYLEEPAVWPWLWPALALFGLALYFAGMRLRKLWLLLLALGLTQVGAWAERDITLAFGSILACAGLAYGLRKW